MDARRSGALATVELPVAVLRSMGIKGVARRAAYEVAKRAGRVPIAPSDSTARLNDSWILPRDLVDDWWRGQPSDAVAAALGRAARVVDGHIDVFGRTRPLGWPPTWHADGEELLPWTGYSDAGTRDIKDTWEPSRFGFVGPLLRAEAAGGQHAVPPVFLALDDWVRRNPPFLGRNWMCGQESSLRAIAVLFAVGALGGPTALDAVDRALVERLLSQTVERVAPTLGYAQSQRNNHAISEASFLWAASVLLEPVDPKLGRRAARALRESVDDQFADDGSYAQHSFTYQRLALHTLLFVDLVCRTTGAQPPVELEDVFSRSHGLLCDLIEPRTGALPNAGGNDGALLFDLTDRPIDDFRPLVSHLAARLGRPRPFPAGSWDEEAAWFGHAPATTAAPAQGVVRTASYHAVRSPRVRAVLRAGARRHRPAHADMLHLDVWIDGALIAFDPGTYRYTAPAPWGNALTGEEVHNVPRVPGHPQAVRAGRFLWRTWTDARLTDDEGGPERQRLRATLDLDGVVITRTVTLRDEVLVVVDEATSDGMVVRWNLPDGTSVADDRADGAAFGARFGGGQVERHSRSFDDPTSGWRSPTYGELVPAVAVEIHAEAHRVVSCFAPPGTAVDDAASTALSTRR